MIKLFEEFNKEPEVYIDYYENGQKHFEEWYLNGEFHREDDPTAKWWSESGQKIIEKWHLNGMGYTREKWIEKLKEIGSEHYEEEKLKYEAEKYNL